MVVTVPVPLHDQTTQSLVATAWMRNALPTWEIAARNMLGISGASVGNVVHSGWNRLFSVLSGLGYGSVVELLNSHSYLPIIRPFMRQASYEQLGSALVFGEIPRLTILSNTRTLSSEGSRFCPACIRSEVSIRGYAYAHRSHQVTGVLLCAEHGSPLIEFHKSDQKMDDFLANGLVVPDFSGKHPENVAVDVPTEEGKLQFCHVYSHFVRAALNECLQPTSITERQLIFSERLHKRFDTSRNPAAKLVSLLRSKVPAQILSAADLELSGAGTANWPALVLDGPMFSRHPIANLIVMSVLFDSMEDFNEAAANTLRRYGDTVLSNEIETKDFEGKRIGLTRGLTRGLIKDYLRDIPLADVALRHNVGAYTLRQFFSCYPRMASRRIQSRLRKRLKAHHSTRQYSLQPFAQVDLRKDVATKTEDSAEAAESLCMLATTVRDGVEQLRFVSQLFLHSSHPDVRTLLQTGRNLRPFLTQGIVDGSMSHHRKLCLLRLSELLNESCIDQARVWGATLLLTYPSDKKLVSQVISCLMTSGQMMQHLAFQPQTERNVAIEVTA